MKKVIMGILAFVPAVSVILWYAEAKIAEFILQRWKNEVNTDVIAVVTLVFMGILFFGIAVYVISLIVYFIYNLKNQYIYPDKKVGWGYMIVCIGIVAMPAYWYNFILKKRS